MANPSIKKAVLQAKNAGKVESFYLENHAAYVKFDKVVDGATTETTVDAVLAELVTYKNAEAVTMDDVNTAVSTAINGVIGGAGEAYDTLKEIETWATEHGDLYTQLVEAVAGKVEKEEGKGLSANDFTNELKAKLEAIDVTNGNFALSSEQVAKLDSIDVSAGKLCVSADQIAKWDGHAQITVGAAAPATMKDGDMHLLVVE